MVANPNYPLETPKELIKKQLFILIFQVQYELGYGFEVLAKICSTKTKLKRGEYQVYGFGLKHNISQYIKILEAKNIHFAAADLIQKKISVLIF
jgi:hypothetical protein